VRGRLAADGFTGDRVQLAWEADLRHEGQATELTVHTSGDGLEEMAALYVAEYLKTYGYQDQSPIELVKVRVVGRGLRAQRLDFKDMRIEARAGAPASRARAIRFARGEAPVDTEVVPRSALSATPRRGPLVIEEFDATMVVPPDGAVARDPIGNIVLDLE
jgi:N-methylhydantoinase A